MRKRDIAIMVARELGMRIDVVLKVINKSLKHIRDGVLSEGKVELRGFGVFRQKHRNARTGFNMNTRQHVHIPARKVIHFNPGKIMKESMLEYKEKS